MCTQGDFDSLPGVRVRGHSSRRLHLLSEPDWLQLAGPVVLARLFAGKEIATEPLSLPSAARRKIRPRCPLPQCQCQHGGSTLAKLATCCHCH